MEPFLLLQKKVRGICSGDGDEDEGNLNYFVVSRNVIIIIIVDLYPF